MLTNRTMRGIAICAVMLPLIFFLAEGKGGDGKAPAPKRGTRSAETELQEVADETLAAALQDEENKKVLENNTCGGLSGEALARSFQNKTPTNMSSPVKSEAKSDKPKASKPIVLKKKGVNECEATV
jgi:hypothetical protein